MYEQYGLSDPFFLMLYGGAAMLALTECCYMLVALRSTLAPHVVPPRELRYWTAAFFAAVAASHLWWAMLGIVWLRDDRLTRDIVAIMLDYITLVPLVMAVLLRLLQDRKRQLWPFFVAHIPIIIIAIYGIMAQSPETKDYMFYYQVAIIVVFIIYVVRALIQYDRWLHENYADLEYKEVWQSLLLLTGVLVFYYAYTSNLGELFHEYLSQVNTLIILIFLSWRVETLQMLLPSDTDVLSADTTQTPSVSANTSLDISSMLLNHCEATQLYLHHDLTLSQLAAAIGTNRTYLSNYFSQQGDTYNTYINRLRIEHFIQLYHEAVSQSHPVTALELSQQCGYRTYRTFSTAFRQHMGITVTAWMQSERSVSQPTRQEVFAKSGRIHKNGGKIYKTLTLPFSRLLSVAENHVTLQAELFKVRMIRRITIAVLMLAVSITLTAQQKVSEKEKTLASQVHQAQMSGNDSAFYQAEEALMNYQKNQKNWERFYSAWLNRIIYEMNHKNFHRAFTEINLITDDIKENGKTEYLYIPNQAMGLYYTSRNYPELGEQYFRRALEGIDTLKNTVAAFNTYLSLAQALSFIRPDEAMECLDHLPKSMLDNPMYDSGVLGYRCIIAHKQGNLDSFNHYFEQYDSIRKNLPDQFNATNLYQVMVCHGLMHHDYQRALAWCDSIDVPLVATELRIDVYDAMHAWEKAYREQIIKDSLIHIDNRNALEDNLEDLTHDIDLLQAEKDKAELRRQELWIISGLGVVIIAMLIAMLFYRHKKNLHLKTQFQQLKEEQERNAELRGIRRAIVGSLKQQLDSPVRVLQGYARVFNDPAFSLPVDERSKHYQDIAKAARSIEAMIEPVIGSYAHGGAGITKEQREICQKALCSSLVTLTMASELIADDVNHQISHEEYMRIRSEISQCAHHVASSVHELMELCLTDEKMKMEKNDLVGLNEIALATLNSYDLRNHDLTFDFATDVDDDVNILTNQHAMQEIINCLLSNADRYATGGDVKMSCQSASDGTYSISIANDGPIISPKYAECLFDPFVRLSEDCQTVGLGLTLARQLAESMGYALMFDASYAEGVRFSVTDIR